MIFNIVKLPVFILGNKLQLVLLSHDAAYYRVFYIYLFFKLIFNPLKVFIENGQINKFEKHQQHINKKGSILKFHCLSFI